MTITTPIGERDAMSEYPTKTMSLWMVTAENSDGPWQAFVRCQSPITAIRLATIRKPWSILDGVTVRGVLDFIDGDEEPFAAPHPNADEGERK